VRVFLFVVGGLFAVAGIVQLTTGGWGDGPGGWWTVARGVARGLDTILIFGAAAGFFLIGATRSGRRSTEPDRMRYSAPAEMGGAAEFLEGRVTVYGYPEVFAVNPRVRIFWNGSEIGSVGRGGVFSFDIVDDGEVRFKVALRSTALLLFADDETEIELSLDRISGKVIARPLTSASAEW